MSQVSETQHSGEMEILVDGESFGIQLRSDEVDCIGVRVTMKMRMRIRQ